MKKFLLLLFAGILIFGCEDTVDKTTSYDNTPRVEYSDCTACGECTINFHCPEDAIKVDPVTYTAYIDADKCTSCMSCINNFECPDNAFTLVKDVISPAQIENFTAVSDSFGKLVLEFTSPGDDSLSGRAYRYELSLKDPEGSNINTDFVEPVPQSAGSEENWILEELPPNTQIAIQILTYDEMQNFSVSQQQVMIMGEDVTAPAAISDLQENPGFYQIELSWTAPGDDGIQGTAAGYELRYSTENISPTNWGDAQIISQVPQPLIAGTQQGCIINDIEEEEEYYFAIKAYDENQNFSDMSNVVNSALLDDTIPPAQIDDLEISQNSITTESFQIEWTAVGDDGEVGSADYYVIKVHTENITSSNWNSIDEIVQNISPQEAGNLETLTISDLLTNTEYFVGIRVYDNSGNISQLSNIAQSTTNIIPDETPPAMIDDLFAEPTETAIELSWTATGDDGMEGTAHHYEIRISQQMITEDNWADANLLEGAPWPLTAGSLQDFTVEDLQQNITYYFAIKAFDESNNVSPLSNVPNGTLIDDTIPPEDITDLEVYEGVTTNLSTIKIMWTAPGDDGDQGTVDHYEIKYSTSPINSSNWDSATTFADVPDPQAAGATQFCYVNVLDPAVIYYFAIKAYDENNNVNQVSNSPGGKIVYQIDTAACRDCSHCIYDCDDNAIQQGPGYKYIDPDLCVACGECSCPWDLIYKAVVAY